MVQVSSEVMLGHELWFVGAEKIWYLFLVSPNNYVSIGSYYILLTREDSLF